jgi:hypothetical protein
MKRHPIQPLIRDGEGTIRFKQNAIVRFLLDDGPFDMDGLAAMDFADSDREQFAQLLGCTLRRFATLRYVSDWTYGEAERSDVRPLDEWDSL